MGVKERQSSVWDLQQIKSPFCVSVCFSLVLKILGILRPLVFPAGDVILHVIFVLLYLLDGKIISCFASLVEENSHGKKLGFICFIVLAEVGL